MPTVSEDTMLNYLSKQDNSAQWMMRYLGKELPAQAALDLQFARDVLDTIKNFIGNHGYFQEKAYRPWDIDPNLCDSQDQQLPWIGWEFETGYKSRAARKTVTDYVWDNFTNVCFDSEGEGNAGTEITFAPEDLGKYESGEAQAIKFIEYLGSIPELCHVGDNNNVGAHINISVPGITPDNHQALAHALARTLAALPRTRDGENVRKKMFGRDTIYGGCFANASLAKNRNRWVEFKLFRTTYSPEVFADHLAVATTIAECAKLLVNRTQDYISNLYDMHYNGAEPVFKTNKYVYMIDGIRGNNVINGQLAEEE